MDRATDGTERDQRRRYLLKGDRHAGTGLAGAAQQRGAFLPQDWILWDGDGAVDVIKLSSGDHIRIDGVGDSASLRDLPASLWSSLGRFEPLLAQLRDQLETEELAPLTRETVLRGSHWRQLFIELTAKCNERCVHCYAESSPARTEALGWNEIRAVLEDAKALDFELVQLTGGDPLVSPHCLRALEAANQLGIPRVEVYTNGLALRGRTYERIRELRPDLAFSFYSHEPETHDTITRTPGSHSRTTQAIRRALEDGLRVRIGVILMEANLDDAEHTYEYLTALGVRDGAIGFDRMRDVGRASSTSAMTEQHRAGSHWGRAQMMRERSFAGSAAVSYDGRVYPCIFSRHLALGSIRELGLATILGSSEPVAPRLQKLLQAKERWGKHLSCWECRARSALLAED